VAEAQARDHEAAAAGHGVGLGGAPAVLHLAHQRLGEFGQPGAVGGQVDALPGGAEVAGVRVVGDAGAQAGHEFVAVGGEVLHMVMATVLAGVSRPTPLPMRASRVG